LTEGKSEGAFRTIGELSTDLGVPQHILRYWETRFPQLRPLTRAGNRRYVKLVCRIHQALNSDGFTIKGVQRLLAGGATPLPVTKLTESKPRLSSVPPELVASLTKIRDLLTDALAG
jgi:DNA-binding transcriptional MerR regulator